ncbi:MAG: AAA family ATPase, partial [Magnetococcales bacterium]|nr:AAA family ATPase [Magnetococcales bacterium]
MAIDSGNLGPVAEAIRGKHPHHTITLMADDDMHMASNPGLTKATEAARAVGGYLAVPGFGPNRPDGVSDFNDLARLHWLTCHPGTRLVIFDTLARIKPPRGRNGDIYAEDYAAVSAFKEISERHGVSIILVHHLRKMVSDDPDDMLSGTTGLAGGVDGTLILTRDARKPTGPLTLHRRGRDLINDEPQERSAIAEFDGGIPRVWAEGLARLCVMPRPEDIPLRQWELIVKAAGMFADRWTAKASSLGWTTEEVFGVHHSGPM